MMTRMERASATSALALPRRRAIRRPPRAPLQGPPAVPRCRRSARPRQHRPRPDHHIWHAGQITYADGHTEPAATNTS
jgi:hypothetical protein